MKTLLKRQIKKYLPEKYQQDKDLHDFFQAIERSYVNAEEQINLVQRASIISFEELKETNKKLEEETKRQSQIIEKLNGVINSIQKVTQDDLDTSKSIDTIKLVDFIDHQTKKIIDLNHEKELLLKDLEQQNAELNNYINMVSHDLKSPLNNIHALANWIQNDNNQHIGIQNKEYLDQIKFHIEKMDNLLRSILTYSTLKFEESTKAISLSTIVKSISTELNFDEKVSITINKELPTINGDKKSMYILFKSILENSIIFNAETHKKIDIAIEKNTNYFKFVISDNGLGIDEKYYQKIFLAFQKLDANSKRSGFGLTISKKIIDLYGGKIWIEPNQPKGTKINFTIPIHASVGNT